MSDTNNIFQGFGPSVFVIVVPKANLSIDQVQAHHTHDRISTGYNTANTIVECSEVQLYDYKDQVKMESKGIVDSNAQGMGHYE